MIADSAYMGKGLLQDRPANVDAIGPICWTAALMEVKADSGWSGRIDGQVLADAAQDLADDPGWPATTDDHV